MMCGFWYIRMHSDHKEGTLNAKDGNFLTILSFYGGKFISKVVKR